MREVCGVVASSRENKSSADQTPGVRPAHSPFPVSVLAPSRAWCEPQGRLQYRLTGGNTCRPDGERERETEEKALEEGCKESGRHVSSPAQATGGLHDPIAGYGPGRAPVPSSPVVPRPQGGESSSRAREGQGTYRH